MIETTYLIRCDGCKLLLGADDDGDFDLPFSFEAAVDAWTSARASGWGTTGHRHYCPDCWTEKRQAVTAS